jgi:hypothetical protein
MGPESSLVRHGHGNPAVCALMKRKVQPRRAGRRAEALIPIQSDLEFAGVCLGFFRVAERITIDFNELLQQLAEAKNAYFDR